MLHDANFENLRLAFAAQFERNAAGYLFRHRQRDAPIQVTADERDAFVAAFDRRLRWAGRGLLAGSIVTFGLVTMLTTGSGLSWQWLYGVAGVWGAGFLIFHYWSRSAPARALSRRPVAGNPRTQAEMDRVILADLSWTMVATGCAGAVALIVCALLDREPGARWHPYGIVAGIALLTLLLVQGARKWRARRRA